MTASDRFVRAIECIDAANAEDPNRERVAGGELPRELLYAQRLTAMLDRFAPDASEPLRLAARCQHVERWKIPRSDYPSTRAGYLRWRTRLRDLHAELAMSILRRAGYDDATIGRVRSLVRKEALKSNPEAQVLEDVVALVFLESYLEGFVAAHPAYDAAKFADILAKTAKKMSPRGRASALAMIAPPAALERIVRRAMLTASGER